MKPINQNVLVRPDAVEEKTSGGLFLPDANKDREQHAQSTGVLVAMCDDAFEEMKSKPEVGQKVWFARYSGAMVNMEGEDLRLLKDIDITAVAA